LFTARRTYDLLKPGIVFRVENYSDRNILQNWQTGFGNIYHQSVKARCL